VKLLNSELRCLEPCDKISQFYSFCLLYLLKCVWFTSLGKDFHLSSLLALKLILCISVLSQASITYGVILKYVNQFEFECACFMIVCLRNMLQYEVFEHYLYAF
jgi:hypothetical protein